MSAAGVLESSDAQLDAAIQPLRTGVGYDQSIRETVESIVVAIILAFLFRGVVAEAFVIPTGSMAPTLQGRHMDVVCPQCNFQYRTGASVENAEAGPARGEVKRTRCPICRFALKLDKRNDPNHCSFNGDRILVSKFAYHLSEPRRWDVVVFKYPGDAKTPYIKRLVGLPGETIRIRHGDIYRLHPGADQESADRRKFAIVRKPPDKVVAMLQLVDDTNHIARQLRRVGWPSRWSQESSAGEHECWKAVEDGTGFHVVAGSDLSWLRYRHRIPRPEDWRNMVKGQRPQLDGYDGQLITDYYAYNDSSAYTESTDWGAQCWVGDLAMELDFEVRGHGGEILLDLVEGGVHHRCTFDLTTGQATLDIDGGRQPFLDGQGHTRLRTTASTPLRGAGAYHVRYANVDDELLVWVNGQVIKFDGGTTFQSPPDVVPQWSSSDAGDLAPAGVGARNTELHVSQLRVLRDVYYRAVEPIDPYKDSEYDKSKVGYGFDVAAAMSNPHCWSKTMLFASRRSVDFPLGADQFFPLGDNSPESRDARLWSEPGGRGDSPYPPPYVARELLIGKALVIYWPHSWRVGSGWLPIIPNFQRMSWIR